MLAKIFGLILLITLLSACTSQRDASDGKAPGGTWSGDYDPGTGRRESISVDLRWENESLQGVVHAGARSLSLSKASFNQDTGAITMEFDAEGNGGRTVHYNVDGKVSGNTMAGTWVHDDQRGDFRVTKR